MSKILYGLGHYESGGPSGLKIESACNGIYVKHFSGEIKPGEVFVFPLKLSLRPKEL